MAKQLARYDYYSVIQVNPNITTNQARLVAKEFLQDNIKETLLPYYPNLQDGNPKIKQAIEEIEKVYKNDKYLCSATTEYANNDFYAAPCLRFTANPHTNNFEFGLFSPADAMTDNKKSYITDYYDMSNNLAQEKLENWYADKKDLIKDCYPNKYKHIDWLFADLLKTQKLIQEQSNILYDSGKTSVQIKDYVKFGAIAAKKNNQTLQEYFTANNNQEGLIKIDLVENVANLKKIEKQIEELINKKINLKEIINQEARTVLGEIETEAKKNEKIILRPNCGTTPGFSTLSDSLESRLKCLTFAGTKQDKTRNKLSECLGFQHIYANNTLKANKLSEVEGLEDERYKNISKLIDYLDGESKDEYLKRINDKETTNGRNETLIKLTKFELEDIASANKIIGKGKPIESIYLSVLDCGGNLQKATDIFYSQAGIMQMYGVLQHFGKNAFADGVFVFEEKTGTKHKIGDYTDVITTIDSRLAANPIGGSYESNENWKDAEKEYLKLYHTSLIKMHKKVIAIQQSVQKYQENPLQIDENIKKLKVEKIDQNICDTNLAYYFKEIQIAKPRISLQEHKPTPTNSQRNSAQNRITAHLQPDIKNQSGQFIKRGSSSASILHNQDRLQINQQNIETSFRANSTLPDIKSSHADKLRNKFDKYLNNTNPSTNF